MKPEIFYLGLLAEDSSIHKGDHYGSKPPHPYSSTCVTKNKNIQLIICLDDTLISVVVPLEVTLHNKITVRKQELTTI